MASANANRKKNRKAGPSKKEPRRRTKNDRSSASQSVLKIGATLKQPGRNQAW